MTDEQLLNSIRQIVREEIRSALTPQPFPEAPEHYPRAVDWSVVARMLGLHGTYPRNFSETLEAFRATGRIPERRQSMLSTKDTPLDEIMANVISNRVYNDFLADRRNKLKAEGKWNPPKKRK